MTNDEIADRRLHNQHLARPTLTDPTAVVAALGAVQAQDYGAATWALGQRVAGATAATIEQAFAAGAILRTHVLRPTWHFIAPADIRWLLALTGPRVQAANGSMYRRLELDAAVVRQSAAVLLTALQGGQHRSRPELVAALRQAGIEAAELLRFTYMIGWAELEGLVCSGPRQGKQHTYALLDERVPPAPPLAREEALAMLARRYFTSHGPATVADFVWWSGLTVTDTRAALALLGSDLTSEAVDGQMYWFAPGPPPAADPAPTAYLLPNYDEYIVGYTNRRAIFDPAHTARLDARGNVLFQHTIVVDGQVVGTWQRTLTTTAVRLDLRPFAPLSAAAAEAVTVAAERYGAFLGLSATLTIGEPSR